MGTKSTGQIRVKIRKHCDCGQLIPDGRRLSCSKECDERTWSIAHPGEPMPDLVQDVFCSTISKTA